MELSEEGGRSNRKNIEKKGQEVEAKNLGLKSNQFLDPVTYKELVEGTKKKESIR